MTSHAAFGKKISAVDDQVSSKETNEFVETLDHFVLTMSRLMVSTPIWKYVATKQWTEFKNTADKFFK